MITDASTIQKQLADWASASKLDGVQISEDGSTLTAPWQKDDEPLDASCQITVQSCTYTAASIFLQILDPDQGLVTYRNACKQYNIADPVKALDKPIIVQYFCGGGDDSKAAAAAAVADEAAPTTKGGKEATPDKNRHGKDRRSSGDKRRRHEHRSGSRHERGHHSKRSSIRDHHHHSPSKEISPNKKKKKPDLVTNEQLFEHLNVVVDKRQGAADADGATAAKTADDDNAADNALRMAQQTITKALSAKGFEIDKSDKEQWNIYKERTSKILSNEIPVGNSASILRANNPRKDLTRVLDLYNESMGISSSRSHHPPGKGGVSSKPTSLSARAAAASKNKPTKKSWLVGKKPIIIVPKGMTAPITLVNAHEFLCNAKFVPRDVMLKQQQNRKTPPTAFTRTIKGDGGSARLSAAGGGIGGLLEYEIMDNPRKLGTDQREWQRIVAVIVLGQGWQFKDWCPPYNNAATLFDKVYGFYISMEGDKIPRDVGGWAVKQSQLNRDKRGLDSVTHASFWNGLDEWMKVYKSELLPQTES